MATKRKDSAAVTKSKAVKKTTKKAPTKKTRKIPPLPKGVKAEDPRKVTEHDIIVAVEGETRGPGPSGGNRLEIKPSLLIQGTSQITREHIDAIAHIIETDVLDLDNACLLAGVEPRAFDHLRNGKGRSKHPDKDYAHQRIRQAEAARYRTLVKEVRETGKAPNLRLLEALEVKVGRKYKTQIMYEVAAILMAVKESVDEETYISILDALAEWNSHELAAMLDDIVEVK